MSRSGWLDRDAAILKEFYDGVDEGPDSRGRVLQYVGIGSMYLTPAEVLIYHLLRQRGFSVDYFIYSDDVPINEVITREREEKIGKDRFWRQSLRHAQRMLKAGRVDYQIIPLAAEAVQMAANVGDLCDILRFEYDGIDFGAIVRGALYRYYKALHFGSNAEDVARRMLTTALMNYLCVRDLCQRHDYRFVIFSHGIYVTWQPVVEYCRRNGIDFICYDRAKKQDSANFNVNQPSPDWSFDAAWDRYSDRQLTPVESTRVREYLQERELQKGDVYSYNACQRAVDLAAEKRRLGIPDDRRVITILTNLICDAANVARDLAFKNALECVIATIDRYSARPEVQVVVRSHPAETVLGTKERYATLIREHFGETLPGHVSLIAPEDNVNSFTMIDLSDVGVVNTSTVGLEMALLGKPVVLIAETHYRGKGFTFDVGSRDEYFQVLESQLAKPHLLKDQVTLAEKYFFMMMFLYQHKLPTRYTGTRFVGYSAKHFSELSPTDALVQIIQRLAAGIPDDFLTWSA